MFPLALPVNWSLAHTHHVLAQFPKLKDWVCCESSLTVRVKELGVSFSVEVLNQSETVLTLEQQQTLKTTDRDALIREVVLKQGNTPLIYAQTLMPHSTILGSEERLAHLGNQSLGQVLFQTKGATRGDIECTEVTHDSDLATFIENHLKQPMHSPVFIRRSLFSLNNKPLLVNECFLPALTEAL